MGTRSWKTTLNQSFGMFFWENKKAHLIIITNHNRATLCENINKKVFIFVIKIKKILKTIWVNKDKFKFFINKLN